MITRSRLQASQVVLVVEAKAAAKIKIINPALNDELLRAIDMLDINRIKRLLRAREIPDVNARGLNGQTPCMYAKELSNYPSICSYAQSIIDILLIAGANPDGHIFDSSMEFTRKINSKLNDQLFEIIKDRDANALKKLLQVKEIPDVNAVILLRNMLIPPLVCAAMPHFINRNSIYLHENPTSFVEMLLIAGADPNSIASNKDTALAVVASDYRYRNIAIMLIEAGANIEKAIVNGNTPLMIAANVNNRSLIRILVFRGAKINVENECGTGFYNSAKKFPAIQRIIKDYKAYQRSLEKVSKKCFVS